MKKYLFGLGAIMLAIVAVSFTTVRPESSRFADVFFQYNLSTFDVEADVEAPGNWVEVSDLTTGCNNTNQKACRIKVSDAVTDGSAPNRTLKSTASIIAAEYVTDGTFYVTQAGSVITPRNKQ